MFGGRLSLLSMGEQIPWPSIGELLAFQPTGGDSWFIQGPLATQSVEPDSMVEWLCLGMDPGSMRMASLRSHTIPHGEEIVGYLFK